MTADFPSRGGRLASNMFRSLRMMARNLFFWCMRMDLVCNLCVFVAR